ncbi:MAG: hypothetical protein DRI77_10800 [Chloroflexi bacterium]|nr:MAG: hypothetical protein DRI77_10800 [Chloroflexota bacterium]
MGTVIQAGGDGDGDDLGREVGRGEHEVSAALLLGQPVGRFAVHADVKVAAIIPSPHTQRQVGAGKGNNDAIGARFAGVGPQLGELPLPFPLSLAGERGIGSGDGLEQGMLPGSQHHTHQE